LTMPSCDNPNVKPECVLTIKSAVIEALAPLDEKISKIHERMFVDNGRKSVQTSLSNLNTHVKVQWGFLSAIIVSIIGAAIWVVRAGLTQ